ncbi:MAG: hypothetical protein E3K37_03450 [Candidatus Kuenenia sp.]|nr:hypothetical protein [Candidatus Kuenenia hertensis]
MAGGKIVLQGTIELLSPTLIGSGRDDHTDVDVLHDVDGKPFIPATSLVGVLKHFIKLDDSYKDDLKRFWGFTSEEKISEKEVEQQSSLCCSDLTLISGSDKPVVRDGIEIDNKNGIVAKGAKYDYQVVERGAKFRLNLGVNLTDSNKSFARQMIATIRKALEMESIQIGAKTNSGLGKIRLSDSHVCEFNFSKKTDVLQWLKKDFSTPNPFTEVPFNIANGVFTINTIFRLKNSFISRSYSADPKAPDAVSIKSGNDFVLTGASLKGVIRSRAERILNTVFDNKIEKSKLVLTRLFGDVDEKNSSKRAVKGKVRVDETLLPNFSSELQTRIKIDRFTGGTIETALFETMPLFADDDKNKQIKDVKITIRDYEDHEAGLMLLVLKDLWTGDLAVGGEKAVGRGVFEGVRADITWDNTTVTLEEGFAGLSSENKEQLEKFITALKDFKEEAHERS